MSDPIEFDDTDFEETDIDDNNKKNNDKTDLVAVSGNLVSNINYKLALFMFALGMFLFSDLFINGILSKISSSVEGECPTTKGTIIQLTIFCLLMLVLDILIKYQWL